jgi:NAD+ synthase
MTERADQFTITLAQLNPTVGDVAGNATKARAARAQAAADGADLVVFPELYIAGYPPEDLVLKPAFQSACRSAIEELARETADGGPAVLIGSPWVEDGKLYNACALLDDGRIAAIRFKANLPNYGVFDEKRLFARGPRTSSNALRKPARKSWWCRTVRLTRATRPTCGCRSRLPVSPKAGCR